MESAREGVVPTVEEEYEISARKVKELLDSGAAVKLIDVREPRDFQRCQIEGSKLIPGGSMPEHLWQVKRWAKDAKLILICHDGMRSLNVAAWLREQGIANCVSMAGGIDAWSILIDPSVPRY